MHHSPLPSPAPPALSRGPRCHQEIGERSQEEVCPVPAHGKSEPLSQGAQSNSSRFPTPAEHPPVARNTEEKDLGDTSRRRSPWGRSLPGRGTAEVTSGLGILANSRDNTDDPSPKRIQVGSRRDAKVQGLIPRAPPSVEGFPPPESGFRENPWSGSRSVQAPGPALAPQNGSGPARL